MSYRKTIHFFFIFTIFFIGLFFIGLSLWTQKYFGKVTIDQTLSTLSLGMHGVLSADSIFLKRFIEWCITWPSIIALFLTMLRKALFLRLPLLIVGISLCIHQYQLFNFVKSLHQPHDDYFASHYVDPRHIIFNAKNPKSLVLIYVESLETTYTKENLFNHDLLKSLEKLDHSISFKNEEQMPGTGWTIASIIATQCGLPLKDVTIFNGNRFGENSHTLLPNAICLSDILASKGYKNIFMNGPDLSFAGVNSFLSNHHYEEMYGKKEWLDQGIPIKNMHAWGLPDDLLFKEATIKLDELMKSNKPFNLTILTIDTHGFDGKINAYCKAQGVHDFPGIIECTANEIAQFVSDIEKKGWLDKLDIVIVGDHLAMQNAVYKKLEKNTSRHIFNLIISKKPLTKNTETVTHFDFLPTILSTLGFEFNSNQLGLGYLAIKTNNKKQTPPPISRLKEMKENIPYNSHRYNELWIPS